MNSKVVSKKISQLVIYGASAVTIVVSPWRNYDSTNLPKLLVLSTLAFSLIAIFLSSRKFVAFYWDRPILLASISFLLFLTLPLLITQSPLNQQFWGMFGRNNGWLAYFCSLVVFLAAALFDKVEDFKRLLNVFVGTAFLVTIYALIQFWGLDPIPWSQKMVIGTLGNINFVSAFFGMTSLAAFSLALRPRIEISRFIALAALVSIDMFLVLTTKSIQGIMLFIAGVALVLYLRFRENSAFRRLRFGYITFLVIGISLTVTGLFNKGPLARFVFAPSVEYRADYWHAGWKISVSHPFSGVGLDSYGDFYREYRGLISTIRTIPERTANTAHNIFLDLSSGGGFPLLISYLVILGLSFRSCLKIARRRKSYDPIFAAISSVLLGYQIQAFVSIAQLGVSIWGWVFMGAAIGYERLTYQREKNQVSSIERTTPSRKRDANSSTDLMPPAVLLSGLVGLSIGFACALPPLVTDASFRSAFESGDLTRMSQAVQRTGSSAYLVGLALEASAKNGNSVVGEPLNVFLNEKYPRDMYGWRVKYAKPWATPLDKQEAIKKMRELDPFNPEIPAS
jgi:O-antigen ligase